MVDDSGEPSGRSALILVVERDPHVRELEAFFLERAGYRVEFAKDGHEALGAIESLNPRIVITEVLVPGMDGLTLCRRVKQGANGSDVRVLVFSFLAASDRARDAGADAYLRKPLGERTLVETVDRLLSEQDQVSE